MITLCEQIRQREVSLFFSVRRAKRARYENDHARDGRREMGEARARELPLLNLKKKRDCS